MGTFTYGHEENEAEGNGESSGYCLQAPGKRHAG